MACDCKDDTSGLPDDITLTYKNVHLEGQTRDELVIEVKNDDGNLTYPSNGINIIKRPLIGEEQCENIFHIKAVVQAGDNAENPLRYDNTGIYKEEGGDKYACVYCVEYPEEEPEIERKKRRKTSVTVTTGGGITD